ncbi:MAG: ribosomal subunit protein [Candidatus Parcubacteria bacterium]
MQKDFRKREYQKKDQSGLKEKVLDLRRVTRVVAGGKRFKFRATVVVGDEKGKIGIGIGKGVDVAQAVGKAKIKATKQMLTIELKDGRTIAHEVRAKYSAAQVLIKPASVGHGLRSGGAVRSVLALAGVKDATSKCLGRTPNKLTNAWATIEALRMLKRVHKKTAAVVPAHTGESTNNL